MMTAQTGAERQSRYRARQRAQGRQRVVVWLEPDAAAAVQRMAAYWDSMTAGKLIGELVREEEQRVINDDLACKPNEVKAYLASVTR